MAVPKTQAWRNIMAITCQAGPQVNRCAGTKHDIRMRFIDEHWTSHAYIRIPIKYVGQGAEHVGRGQDIAIEKVEIPSRRMTDPLISSSRGP